MRCAWPYGDGNQLQALEILNREKFYVMFLDLAFLRMDGVQLCKKIRKEEPYLIIAAVTGYSSTFQLADCREAGFDDYFAKQFKSAVLLYSAHAFEVLDRWKGV